ncbi:MAG: tyrosine-type recombinase/integrase [Mycolicibacterium frederiksbergense]|nr:tyrosine-type recombinase/integrase [Mycolicibacterium frederiksbergense]
MARELGGRPADVTEKRLRDWFGSQKQWSNETRRGYRSSAIGFFGWAAETGRTPANIALKLPAVKPTPPAPRPLPDGAWATGIEQADARTRLMLRLAAEGGLRRAEVAQVSTSDLSFGLSGAQLLVHGKGNKKRVIPITDELAELIAAGAPGHTPALAAFGHDGYLFPGDDGGHLSPRWVGTLCKRVLPGIWTLHKCRHRYAAKVYRGSRNLRALQMLLGHASVATTEVYTPVDDDEIRAAMLHAAA